MVYIRVGYILPIPWSKDILLGLNNIITLIKANLLEQSEGVQQHV